MKSASWASKRRRASVTTSSRRSRLDVASRMLCWRIVSASPRKSMTMFSSVARACSKVAWTTLCVCARLSAKSRTTPSRAVPQALSRPTISASGMPTTRPGPISGMPPAEAASHTAKPPAEAVALVAPVAMAPQPCKGGAGVKHTATESLNAAPLPCEKQSACNASIS